MKRPASEDWPIGSECSQKAAVNIEEITSVELAIEDEADVHTFRSLLAHVGYTTW